MALATLHPLSAAGLLLTDWCPAACRHCYVSCGPGGRAWMALEDAEAHFSALARLNVAAEAIHLGGGEPFGDFERLLAVVRAARRAGLDGVGYVETCGYWATSEEIVRDRLGALAQAGMRQISISADPYHQEFVPPDRVRILYAAAREALGPDGVRARRWRWLKACCTTKAVSATGGLSASARAGKPPVAPILEEEPRNVSALPEAARLKLFCAFLRRYPERMTGRAARDLAALVDRVPLDEIAPGPCCQPLLEGCHVHVGPQGWVYPGTCAGIALGRAGPGRPLDRLLREWRGEGSPIVEALARGGPRALADDARAHGFEPDPQGYAGKCHLCWSVRTFLARAGAGGEELQPEAVYAG